MPRAGSIVKGRNCGRSAGNAYKLQMEARNTIGRLYAAWKRGGKKPREFETLLKDAGYRVSRSTLNCWSRFIDKGREPVLRTRKAGHKRLLDAKEDKILTGYILRQNTLGIPVSVQSVLRFARNRLGKKLSPTTARSFLKRNYLSLHTFRPQTVVPCTKLAVYYRNWLKEQHKFGTLRLSKDRIGSLDFTYTSHRTARPLTFSGTDR